MHGKVGEGCGIPRVRAARVQHTRGRQRAVAPGRDRAAPGCLRCDALLGMRSFTGDKGVIACDIATALVLPVDAGSVVYRQASW